MAEQEEAVARFQEVTDCADPTFAASFLQAHGWDLESSVEAFLTGDSSDARGTPGREHPGVAPVETDDDVRAPIPAIRDTLLDAGAGFGGGVVSGFNPRTPRTVFDAFRDYRREEALQKRKDKHVEAIIKERPAAEQSKLRTLANIFRPPLEVLFTGSFERAKREGSLQKRWLLVNIQDVQEFASSQLNRDTWSNPELKKMIADSFLMVQTSKDSEEGKRYSLLYKLGEYPHIGLLDPRTGQLLRSWGGFVAAATLLDELRSFVASHSLDDLSAAPLPPQQSRPQSDRTTKQKAKVDLTEEEMLAEAIAASLRESHPQATDTVETKKRKIVAEEEDDDEEDEEEDKDKDQDDDDHSHDADDGSAVEKAQGDLLGEDRIARARKRYKTAHAPATTTDDPPSSRSGVSSSSGSSGTAEGYGHVATEHTGEAEGVEAAAGAECTLQIRAMDGSTFSAAFREGDTLGKVRRWLISHGRLGSSSSFALVSPFPRRTFGDADLGLSLQSLGLTPRAVLIIHPTSPVVK